MNKLTSQDLTALLDICNKTKSAELTDHDNLVFDVITMDKFKQVVEFAKRAKKAIEKGIIFESDHKMIRRYWSK